MVNQQGQPVCSQGAQSGMIMNQQMGIQAQRMIVSQNNQQGGVMMQQQPDIPQDAQGDVITDGDGNKSQQKADQIVQDAMARAQAQGLPMPKIVTPADLDPNKKGRSRKKAGDGTRKRSSRAKKQKIEVKVENPTLTPSSAVEERVPTPGVPPAAEESSQDADIGTKDANEEGVKTVKKGRTPIRRRTVPQLKKRKL